MMYFNFYVDEDGTVGSTTNFAHNLLPEIVAMIATRLNEELQLLHTEENDDEFHEEELKGLSVKLPFSFNKSLVGITDDDEILDIIGKGITIGECELTIPQLRLARIMTSLYSDYYINKSKSEIEEM